MIGESRYLATVASQRVRRRTTNCVPFTTTTAAATAISPAHQLTWSVSSTTTTIHK